MLAATATAGTHPPPDLLPDILDLAGDPGRYGVFERAAGRVNHCAHPIRLHGRTHQADLATGELREVYSTKAEPGRVLLVPCGNRRASVCPACAETYRADAYQLLRAGLAGGKGVPASVAEHPALFVTFTAPSFGPVHTHHANRTGRLLPCHPRRRLQVCPHGIRLDCRRTHPAGDPRVGEPLCPDCYQYDAQVLFNALAPELWRPPKTRASRRTVGLPRFVVMELGEHLAGGNDPRAFVFTATRRGPFRPSNFRDRVWRPTTAAAGLDRLRIHDLRHTAVALWIAAGASPKEVAARAGHTSVSFTLDRYGHLYPEADQALRDRLDALHKAATI
ncbi:MAG TPA: site-specific integrase [Actinomycetes bacterium]|nr:site-specific integrase [Actinomycetes bacterium]